ncbi:MAG TPA: tetratricopeptide repeat protein [Dongiaceae bacterium]
MTLFIALLAASCIAFDASGRAENIAPLSQNAIAGYQAEAEIQQGREALKDPRSAAEARDDFTKAASRGNPVAQTYLGYLSYMGYGVEQNDKIAADWYRRAASQGLLVAQIRLAILYEAGRDLLDPSRNLQPDDNEAKKWFKLAAAQGDVQALLALREYREAAKKNNLFALNAMCFSDMNRNIAGQDSPWCTRLDQQEAIQHASNSAELSQVSSTFGPISSDSLADDPFPASPPAN